MLRKKGTKSRKTTVIIITGIILAIAVAWRTFMPVDTRVGSEGKNPVQTDSNTGSQPLEKTDPDKVEPDKGVVKGEIQLKPTMDYNDLETDDKLKTLMDTRKDDLGLQKSIDMVVKSNESIIVGGSKVSVREILEKAFTKQGGVYQEEILASGGSQPVKIKEYGIHVVQPGDNIWNIHFNILKEYYAHRGIKVSTKADEPGTQGFSSGVGKILKFSETMVIIYNLVEKKVVKDINLLEPLSKIVVYNMDEVFALLEEIDYDNVDRIQFDGKSIWIPAKKS